MTKSPMTRPPLRWGMIGCGSVAEVKSGPAYQQTPGFTLQAVTRRDQEKAKDYARRHGVPEVYRDARDLIYASTVDAIYIATPPDSHACYALEVARAGKVCCVEKPLAPSYAACLTIQNAFDKAALPLFVAYYRRSLPRFERIRAWLTEGALGEVRHVNWRFTRPASDRDRSGGPNWRTDAAVAPGGYFDDLASHGLDLITFLLGEVSSAVGISTNQQGLYSAKDAVSGSWLHRSGATGSGSWTFGAGERSDRLEILGSEGVISFSVFGEVPLKLSSRARTEEVFLENPRHIQRPHVGNMQRHLAGELQHPSTGASAAHTAWVMAQLLG
jgi:1,5-anhydro-D-fructose reductase (1,5-anhydro-D-mannitol-forming)